MTLLRPWFQAPHPKELQDYRGLGGDPVPSDGKAAQCRRRTSLGPITQNLENKSRGSGLEPRGGNPEVESFTLFCTNPPYATPSPWARRSVWDSPGHPWRLAPPPYECRRPYGSGNYPSRGSDLPAPTRSGTVGSRDRCRRGCLRDTEAKAGRDRVLGEAGVVHTDAQDAGSLCCWGCGNGGKGGRERILGESRLSPSQKVIP